MRIWDLPANILCDRHLLAEHRELHGVWAIITQGKKGYSRHPEVLRWIGRLRQLRARHEEQAREMKARGFRHNSPLTGRVPEGAQVRPELIQSLEEQAAILEAKGCGCKVEEWRRKRFGSRN